MSSYPGAELYPQGWREERWDTEEGLGLYVHLLAHYSLYPAWPISPHPSSYAALGLH